MGIVVNSRLTFAGIPVDGVLRQRFLVIGANSNYSLYESGLGQVGGSEHFEVLSCLTLSAVGAVSENDVGEYSFLSSTGSETVAQYNQDENTLEIETGPYSVEVSGTPLRYTAATRFDAVAITESLLILCE